MALGLAAKPTPVAGQADSAMIGPPPHFVAAEAAAGMLRDVSQQGVLRQRLTVDVTDVPLDTALTRIREQGGLHLLYRPDLLPVGRRVSLRATGITVAAALAVVLFETGLDVVMTRGGQLVLVVCPHWPAGSGGDDESVVAGRVLDRTTGAPLAGASVTVVGTQLAALANADGQYRLDGLAAGRRLVSARYIGYAPTTVAVQVGPGRVVQDFALAPAVQQLEQVVVTGPLVPTAVKALPTPITIITAEDIRRQNVLRMDQLFRGQEAGVLARDLTAEDYFSIINIRGANTLDTRPIKAFIDGIELADPALITLIDPNSIDRIELTRGPQASAMYGSDAIGGALQVLTKRGTFGLTRPKGEIKASASIIERNDGPGVAARFVNALTLRGGEQHTRYHLAGFYRRDGEWTPSYRNTNWSLTAGAENVQGPLTSRISALFARKIFSRPWRTALRDSGYTFFSKPPDETIEPQAQTYGVNFVYTAKPWWRHDLVLGYDCSTFEFLQTRRRFTAPGDTLLQVIMSDRSKMSIFYHTTVNARLSASIGTRLTVGVNHYRFNGSNTLSPATNYLSGALDGPTTILRLPFTNTGYFAQTQFDLAEALFVTAGLRAERNSNFGADIGTAMSPRLGVAYVRPVGGVAIKLRLSYGESIRPPDPAQSEAVSSAQFERLANSALRPERQRGVDGGLDLYWGSRAVFSATYYSQDAVDLIDQVVLGTVGDPPRQQSQQQNVGSIRNRGWEVEARYNRERLQVAGTFSATNSGIRQLARGYSGDYRVGDRVLGALQNSAGMTIRYSPSENTTVRGNVTHGGSWIERDLIAFYGALFGGLPRRPSDRDYWISYPGFTRFKLGLEQKIWKGISGILDVENITNDRAFEQNNLYVPAPRTLVFTVRTPY